ncbi:MULTISPECIES: type II toxin-antitoxin system VapC family toxin [unclassified Anabaena]|uniref:type II toxin-antitoxin system VapC family toxin n=1 Tax=unclassified Anabaena TaxID=2619674 RepID=UPI000835FACE|nr:MULTISPECIES: type II toxin-antitoxin system VapC family toxin [unclassified Anabaena]
MYIFDTDHLSVLDRGGVQAQPLLMRLANINPNQVAVTIISYEEQMRGWMSYIAKAQTVEGQVLAYKELKKQLTNYCVIPILEFDQPAAEEFQRLKKAYPRLGTMDLKIAAIALVSQAILLTRNNADFGQIPGLNLENWT